MPDYLSFPEYGIFAIVLAVLFAVTVSEYHSMPSYVWLAPRKNSLRRAATILFLGILLTLLVGLCLAEISKHWGADFFPMIIPVSAMVYWAWHYKLKSPVIDLDLFEEEIRVVYENEVLNTLQGAIENQLSFKDVYAGFRFNEGIISKVYGAIYAVKPSIGVILPERYFIELFSPFIMNETKLKKILNGMRKDGKIKDVNGNYKLILPNGYTG